MDARPIDRWFDSYSGDHRNATNQRIHVVAVPAILWSVIALLWCIPVPPGGWFKPGIFAALAMFGAWMFYFKASRALGFGMLAMFVAMSWLTWWMYWALGARALLFVVGNPGTRPTALREYLGITSAGVTTLIDRLVNRSLVRFPWPGRLPVNQTVTRSPGRAPRTTPRYSA